MYEKFKNKTGYDIKRFFEDFAIFVERQYPSIVAYYNSGVLKEEAFYELDRLIKESNKIEPLFVLHKQVLDSLDDWELLDTFSDIQTKLQTIRNSGKWLRSAYNVSRHNEIQVQRLLKQGEQFEEVAEDIQYENPEDDWLNIVTNQYIREEDYSLSHSPLFKIKFQNRGINELDTVVDTLEGENIFGKDFDVSFSFESNDLKTVTSNQALVQALDLILSSLKGTIPEFPEYGISNDFIGTTVNAIQYNVIFRSILNMFQRDRRWQSVDLLDIEAKEDSIFIKLKATAISNKDYVVTIPI